MKRLIVLMLLSLSVMKAISQDVLFKEEFDLNINNWAEFSDETGSSKVDSGNYILQSLQNTRQFFLSHPIYFEHDQDYSFITSFTFLTDDTLSKAGFIWGASDQSNGNGINFNKNGIVEILTWKNGKQTKISSTQIPNFNQKLPVTIEIKRKENEQTFLVNNQKIYSTTALNISGDALGWYLSGKISCSVEEVKLLQKSKVKVVQGLPDYIKKENLGNNINSKYSEAYPVISPDGKTLYFSIEASPENTGGVTDMDEIYFATLQNDGSWSAKKPIGKPLNNAEANFVLAANNGNYLLLGNTYNKKGETKTDGFSYTELVNNQWSVPKNLKISNYYNGGDFKTACLSSDGTILIMALEGDPNFGEYDLYVSLKDNKGNWSKPKNLGSVINTKGAEIAPFLAQDNKTLFFSSNVHPGYGDNDIFMTKRTGENWDEWSAPENLGPQINSKYWDAYFNFSDSADYAYMVSHQYSNGGADIFKLELPEVLKPESLRKKVKIEDEFITVDMMNIDGTENYISRDLQFSVILKEGFQHEVDVTVTAMSLSGTINPTLPDKDCSGYTISLATPLDSILQSTGTDSTCSYIFSNLKPGTYKLIIQSHKQSQTSAFTYSFNDPKPYIRRQMNSVKQKEIIVDRETVAHLTSGNADKTKINKKIRKNEDLGDSKKDAVNLNKKEVVSNVKKMESGNTYTIDGTLSNPKGYGIQIFSFVRPENVEQILDKLKTNGINNVYIQVVFLNEAGYQNQKFHRVFVGEFKSFNTARKESERLKGLGFQALIREYGQ